MIGIHHTKRTFSDRWIAYCEAQKISYKIVDCYHTDIISALKDCDALMWHFSHINPKDFLFAKQLITALEKSGKTVFPDLNTSWHFDDKVAQKYLLESLEIPLVPTYVFYSLSSALDWIGSTTFPKVFKLRGGAGSVNVKLVKNKAAAIHLARKAFSTGFKHDSLVPFSDMVKKYKAGKADLKAIAKSALREFIPTEFAKMHGREKGYIYFQDFLPGNTFDIRIIIINGKAFALKRMVRENDFRASGSGVFRYEREAFDEAVLKIAFDASAKLNAQCVAFDFVFDHEKKPLIVEISYGFTPSGYDKCPGYWDRELNWHEGPFNPYGWMVDLIVNRIDA
jgi:glutathione synthase/RimK-type ligase-like ATP-grasp enzyme